MMTLFFRESRWAVFLKMERSRGFCANEIWTAHKMMCRLLLPLLALSILAAPPLWANEAEDMLELVPRRKKLLLRLNLPKGFHLAPDAPLKLAGETLKKGKKRKLLGKGLAT